MSAPAASEALATAVTPTVRASLRRRALWIVVGSILLVVGIALTLGRGPGDTGAPFASDNPGPQGAMALAEVLGQQGVEVRAADSLDAAEAAAAEPSSTTVLLYDVGGFLTGEQLDRLGTIAGRIVLVQPSTPALDRWAPTVALAGSAADGGSAPAQCALPVAERAGEVLPGPSAVQPADDSAVDAEFCFPDGDGGFQLAATTTDGVDVVVLAAASPFDNEHVAGAGNAALALGLLGATERLVWYTPGIADLPLGDAQPGVAELTPGWVTPVLLLLLIVFVAAAVWRGRRIGPLVVENLPVVVRSRETVAGRARLYQASSAREHAIDSLRIGATGRIATLLGLPRTATLEDVVRAAAASTGLTAESIRSVLVQDSPATDAQLVAASDRLSALEERVRRSTDPRRTAGGTPERMDP